METNAPQEQADRLASDLREESRARVRLIDDLHFRLTAIEQRPSKPAGTMGCPLNAAQQAVLFDYSENRERDPMPGADDMLELKRYVDERIDELSRRQCSQSFVNSVAGRLGDLEDSKREILEQAGRIDRRLEALESHRAPAHREAAQENLRLWGELSVLDHYKRAIGGLRQWFALPEDASPEAIAEMVKEKSMETAKKLGELAASSVQARNPTHVEGKLLKEMHASCIEHAATKSELGRLRSLLQLEDDEDAERTIRILYENVGLLNAANDEIRRLRRQIKLEAKDEAELAEYATAAMAVEFHRLRAENERLQSELDELLGTEFFKTGERLRRGAAGIVAADLTKILLDERAGFWLRMILERARAEFGDPASQVAVNGLLRWRSEINRWCDAHLSHTATIREGDAVSISEAGDLKRAGIYKQWGETRMFDDSGNLLDEHRHISPTSTEE